MPLVRASPTAPTPKPPPESRDALLQRLTATNQADRRRAAHALAADPTAVVILADRLELEPDPAVRDALFAALVDIGGATAAERLAALVHLDDAALRGGAIQALKAFKPPACVALDGLLQNPDPDVRLLAIEVTRAWPAELAAPRLRRIIDSDPHVNVCAAAVDVAAELGTAELIFPLAALRLRFADNAFLGFAVDVASARIADSAGREN
jgi:HEAT repeat protein